VGRILDDFESRPGSTTSLLRTIVGLYLRRLGGWIPVAGLVSLMADLGVPDSLTRTGVLRLKQKGLLVADRRDAIGYRLAAEAESMLAAGDRRIFHVRAMRPGDAWCVVSFSIPEQRRDVRHQLRRRLSWIGCGTVSPALWICPDHLAGEVEAILEELDVRRYATLFRTEEPRPPRPMAEAVREWWDLDAIARLHTEFLAAREGTRPRRLPDRDAFTRYVRLIDDWRLIPYLDPGLPATLLPPDWPGRRSIPRFLDESARLAEPAWRYVEQVLR